MLLLAIDTSGRNGSIALCRGERDSFETLQLLRLEGGTYSARLMPAIAQMLSDEGLHKEQTDAFVVVSGPGSFTGLRVGIATVKGLCEVLQKPLVAVSMLEAVAAVRARGEERVAIALDAGRSEVYVGEFALVNAGAALLREYVGKLDAFADDMASRQMLVVAIDGNVADALLVAGAKFRRVDPLDAADIGRIGYAKLLAGETTDAAVLDANYIRRSDAELFSTPKR